MIKLIKSLLPFKFKRALKEHLGVPSLHWSLQNLRKKGYIPKVAIDVGAYEGHWTVDFLEVFPDAKVLMLEAQNSKEIYLQDLSKKFPNVSYAIALLSSEDNKKVLFNENETSSQVNVLATDFELQNANTKTTITLDTLVKNLAFPNATFMKLDVQGYEIEVLKGAISTILTVEVCMLEVTLLSLGDGSPLMIELINFMDNLGFQMYDISQFIKRPFDKAMYQMDVFFVKNNSFLVTDKRWK